MKKIVFFLPAIVFTIFYSWLALEGVGAINPIVILWLIMCWGAGILLSKRVYGGALFGIIPPLYFIYMSTQESGQVINIELPIGIVLIFFYVICGYFIYKHRIS